jgi:hypothetical protein
MLGRAGEIVESYVIVDEATGLETTGALAPPAT